MKARFGWIGVTLIGLAILVVLSGPLRWATAGVQRRLIPEERPELHVYEELAKKPLSLAGFERELRAAWPDQDVATVHAAVSELATGLLHHDDVEVGSLEGNKFVPWRMAPWEAANKIKADLKARSGQLPDEGGVVFQRKK